MKTKIPKIRIVPMHITKKQKMAITGATASLKAGAEAMQQACRLASVSTKEAIKNISDLYNRK